MQRGELDKVALVASVILLAAISLLVVAFLRLPIDALLQRRSLITASENGAAVYLREGPDDGSAVLAELPDGERFTMICWESDAEARMWFYGRPESDLSPGYVRSSHVALQIRVDRC
jgi:hypothetical protein